MNAVSGSHFSFLEEKQIQLDSVQIELAFANGNQSTVLSLAPQATSRTNTIYVVTYFAGGALGSYTGGLASHHFGWPGVTALGLLFSCTAVFVRFVAWMPGTAGVIKRA